MGLDSSLDIGKAINHPLVLLFDLIFAILILIFRDSTKRKGVRLDFEGIGDAFGSFTFVYLIDFFVQTHHIIFSVLSQMVFLICIPIYHLQLS